MMHGQQNIKFTSIKSFKILVMSELEATFYRHLIVTTVNIKELYRATYLNLCFNFTPTTDAKLFTLCSDTQRNNETA
jgi:hypothetical protein